MKANLNAGDPFPADTDVSRRDFLRMTSIAALSVPITGLGEAAVAGISIVAAPGDKIAQSVPGKWAAAELEQALVRKGIRVQRCTSLKEALAVNKCIVISDANAALAISLFKSAGVTIPAKPEALALVPVRSGERQIVLASARDERGMVYALLEIADRVNFSSSALTALTIGRPVVEQPANKIRGLNRLFVSDIEDKPWFNDREMWPQYLTLLASQRFNRFNLSLGIGYDFLREVTDSYFLFSYPFLVDVPAYNVKASGLPDSERDRNLELLRFISAETVKRGMEFSLGLWMHGYEWINSPKPNYTITGLTKETHAAYCRDAVNTLLRACPDISGITFRVHGESGVNEGSYDFWKTIFTGVATCGRTVSIDMHSKGIDQKMLDTALSVNLPLTVSPKFWAEHMGMPYHQADIRELEIPKPDKRTSALMNLSEGSRSFMRYGYGDLLKEDRKFGVLHRIWPGTQRLLLWGDPLTGAAQSRIFSFCGSAGVELMEPLSFKGRRGSGVAGDRCGYLDASLKPRWDWQKYEYSLRVFGRTLYNPDTDPDVWRRYLKNKFGPGASAVEQGLARATRILPTVLTAHAPSAGNNNYWPEMYTNLAISSATIKHPYTDTPAPKVFGTVSPLDPQLFSGINEFVRELLATGPSGKYTPVEVAQWISDHASAAEKSLQEARLSSTGRSSAEYRRMEVDVNMQAGLGKFFACKLRAGALFAVFEQTGSVAALAASLKIYREARGYWAALAERARIVYKDDVSAGELPFLRGHWTDRLPAIDEDIDNMSSMLSKASQNPPAENPANQSFINACLERPVRVAITCQHRVPGVFRAGEAITLDLVPTDALKSADLFYRHVNQGERYQLVQMQKSGNTYSAIIPAAYTDSPFPLEYYFRLKNAEGKATIFPGLGRELTQQPYFVVRKA